MNARNEQGLFGALKAELQRAREPLSSADLYDIPSIRDFAETVNRVSDYLGHMWRKGEVLRLPAPRQEGTRARWLYVWKNKVPPKKKPVDLSQAIEFDPTVGALLNRPNMSVTEEGDTVVITLPAITITIKQNK